jgi:hypothetical protein
MSKSRVIGTRAESAVVKVAREHGFPMAMRLPLSGRLDRGDVLLNPGDAHPVYIEVKAGDKAKKASDNQIVVWLDEAVKAAAPGQGLLVVPRERRPPGHWWAIRYSGTRVIYEWLETALEAQSQALQAQAWGEKMYGSDPKVNFHPTEPILARVPVRDVVVEYEEDEIDPVPFDDLSELY